MIKMMSIFIGFTVFFGIVILAIRRLNHWERWALTKWVGYSILCSMLTTLVLSLIVFLF